MNPFIIFNIFSYKNELKFVLTAFFIILSLPIIAVFILINSGIDIISDHLVTHVSQNNTTIIHNPNGLNTTQISNPVEWPVHGIVTLEFGQPDIPFQLLHTGIDIANPFKKEGDPITPFMDGTVIYAGKIWWGFGEHIIIDNGNNINSTYAHLSKIFVYSGEKVKLGQIIGLEGQSGWATGPHLHFQVNVFGIPVNPRNFLKNNP